MIFLIPFITWAVIFFATVMSAPSVLLMKMEQAYVPVAATMDIHYTKGVVVHINPVTGATRFVPYRLAGDLDRRQRRSEQV